MTAMPSVGHSAVPCVISAIAWAGEGGSCGHHQWGGWARAATALAMRCALNDCGEERKPCR